MRTLHECYPPCSIPRHGFIEALDEERANWERRGREMEAVLRKVKEEIVLGQREREALESQLEETEERR